jgi:hypothetical protein
MPVGDDFVAYWLDAAVNAMLCVGGAVPRANMIFWPGVRNELRSDGVVTTNSLLPLLAL